MAEKYFPSGLLQPDHLIIQLHRDVTEYDRGDPYGRKDLDGEIMESFQMSPSQPLKVLMPHKLS